MKMYTMFTFQIDHATIFIFNVWKTLMTLYAVVHDVLIGHSEARKECYVEQHNMERCYNFWWFGFHAWDSEYPAVVYGCNICTGFLDKWGMCIQHNIQMQAYKNHFHLVAKMTTCLKFSTWIRVEQWLYRRWLVVSSQTAKMSNTFWLWKNRQAITGQGSHSK